MIIIPVLALSALFKLTNPDVTLPASRITSALSVAHFGTERVEVGLEYSSLPQVSHLSLPGQCSLGVDRGPQLGSRVDLSLRSASLPTPTRKSSPTSRAVTHESGTLTHQKSNVTCRTVCRLLAFKVPSTGLLSFSSSSSRSSSDSLSTLNLHHHVSANVSSTLNSITLPVYGPEWEWSPRDLVVYIPQPSCPVPVLRSDMSTVPTLNLCTLGSRDYYADVIRGAMLKQMSVVSRLDWCGRGSHALQEALKQAAIARHELAHRKSAYHRSFIVKPSHQQRLARLGLIYQCQGAFLPLALCFVAFTVVYGLIMYPFGNDLDSYEVKKKVSSADDSLACVNTPEPPVSHSSQTHADVPSQSNNKYYVNFYAPRRRVRAPFVPQPHVETRATTQEVVKFCTTRCRLTILPPQTQVDFHPCLMPERPNQVVDVVEDPSPEPSGLTDEVEAGLEDVQTTQSEQVDQASSEEKVLEEEQREEDVEDQGLEEPNFAEEGHQEEQRVKLAPLLPLPVTPDSSLTHVPEPVAAEPEEDTEGAHAGPFDWAADAQEELEKNAVDAQRECDEQVRREGVERQEKEREAEKEQEGKLPEPELMESEEQAKARRLAAWKEMGGGDGWVAILSRDAMPACVEEDKEGSWTVVQRRKGSNSNQIVGGGRSGGGSDGGNSGRNGKGLYGEAGAKVSGQSRH